MLLLRTDLEMETGWRGTMPVSPGIHCTQAMEDVSLPLLCPRLGTVSQASLQTAWKDQGAGVMVRKDEYKLTRLLNSASASN